jgi:hypothetical protein
MEESRLGILSFRIGFITLYKESPDRDEKRQTGSFRGAEETDNGVREILSVFKKTREDDLMKRKKGFIIAVHPIGSVWQIDVAERIERGHPRGKITSISGDWRPMRDALDSAFNISTKEFPYVSGKKMSENVFGQQIEYFTDSIFGAKSWEPTGIKKKLKDVV